jgi:hypothetical protein
MWTLKSLAMATTVALFVNVLGAIGDAAPPASGVASGAKTDTFSVVSIVGGPTDDIRVVSVAELDELRKSIQEEDKAQMEAYKKNKKGTKEDGNALPKPTMRTIKTLKAGFKTADDAEDWKAAHPPGAPKVNSKKKTAN